MVDCLKPVLIGRVMIAKIIAVERRKDDIQEFQETKSLRGHGISQENRDIKSPRGAGNGSVALFQGSDDDESILGIEYCLSLMLKALADEKQRRGWSPALARR
jgi:hypothetical protein